MRKLFLKKSEQGYEILEGAETVNFDLQYLWQSFDSAYEDILIDKDVDEDSVLIWSALELKQPVTTGFESKQEQEAYDKAYDRYVELRWEDMPILDLSIANYQEVKQSWQNVEAQKPEYVIFQEDEKGFVMIHLQDKLSEKDKRDIIIESEIFQTYQVKYDDYMQKHPQEDNDIWYSEQDSQFYSDFLEQDEIAWKNNF